MTPRLHEHTVDNAPVIVSLPTYTEIAERAFLLYETRGGSDGRDIDDWLTAERQLLSERLQDVENARD